MVDHITKSGLLQKSEQHDNCKSSRTQVIKKEGGQVLNNTFQEKYTAVVPSLQIFR